MKGVVEWCYKHTPEDIVNAGTYAVLDYCIDRDLLKYLLRHCRYEEDFLHDMSLEDVVNTPESERYVVLLSHILLNDIHGVDGYNMCLYITWMLMDRSFETGLIAYLWENSQLNSVWKYPLHADMLEVVRKGCNRDTLQFLWSSAISNDSFLCEVISRLSDVIGAPYYLKLLTYTYVCSGVDSSTLATFFMDIYKDREMSIAGFVDNYTTYTWTAKIINQCLDRGYTVHKLMKPVNKAAGDSFVFAGREFPVDSLPIRFRPVKVKHTDMFDGLPELPKDYKITYSMWNLRYHANFFTPMSVKNKYERWFEELNIDQLNKLKDTNPVVYDACSEGNFQYVAPILDDYIRTFS